MKAALASIFLVSCGAALDIGSKAWARASLVAYGPPIEFLPLIPLRLTFNTGVSFSLLSSDSDIGRYLLIAVTGLIAAVMAIWLHRSQGWQRVGLSFILAGAMGNLLDRTARGSVTDFLSLRIGEWEPFVFNLADVWITIGAAILLAASGLQSKDAAAEGPRPR
ncbi:MAG: signal peptidase II [Hydrogenophaga sp.]|uniref:signal peptidase II n=1 Tax=Brucella rhizosphaerae TaxID=571254 RepID=UPI000467C537|nr:signal peptidase II [Brucella rhizosphaerae]MBW8301863.1 signal peptidase II [Hydrogenophaga sp.]